MLRMILVILVLALMACGNNPTEYNIEGLKEFKTVSPVQTYCEAEKVEESKEISLSCRFFNSSADPLYIDQVRWEFFREGEDVDIPFTKLDIETETLTTTAAIRSIEIQPGKTYEGEVTGVLDTDTLPSSWEVVVTYSDINYEVLAVKKYEGELSKQGEK